MSKVGAPARSSLDFLYSALTIAHVKLSLTNERRWENDEGEVENIIQDPICLCSASSPQLPCAESNANELSIANCNMKRRWGGIRKNNWLHAANEASQSRIFEE